MSPFSEYNLITDQRIKSHVSRLTEFENKVQQLAQSEEDGGKEAEGLSCKDGDDLSDSHDEDRIHKYASPSVQAVIRNPEYLKSQMRASHQKEGEKAVFSWELCTYTSLKISSLNRHRKIHSEEKRQVCHICLKAFRTATLLHNHEEHLIVHNQTHSDEKFFPCSCCSETFQQKQLFTIHSKKHCDSSLKSTAYECLSVGGWMEAQSNCGLVKAKTATPRKRSKDRRKEGENLKHAKQEDVSTVKSERCAREIAPVLEGIEATALKAEDRTTL